MGVPFFFAYIQKKNIENLILNNITENIDHLSFDMNCMIHPCFNKIIEKYNKNELIIDKTKNIRNQIENYIFDEIIQLCSLYIFCYIC